VMKPDGETEEALRNAMSPEQTDTALNVTACTLQSMGRNGDTILAHITPAEAQLLDSITDGASINPDTGLLEFWHDYEAEAYGVGSIEQNSGSDRGDKGSNGRNDKGSTTPDTLGSQDTLGGGTSLTPVGKTNTDTPDISEDTSTKNRTRRSVLAPDNDLSFTAGFFDKKGAKESPAEDAASMLNKSNRVNKGTVNMDGMDVSYVRDDKNGAGARRRDYRVGSTDWSFVLDATDAKKTDQAVIGEFGKEWGADIYEKSMYSPLQHKIRSILQDIYGKSPRQKKAFPTT